MKTLPLLMFAALACSAVQAEIPTDAPDYPHTYCAQRRAVVKQYVLIYGMARNQFAAEKQFGDYTQSIYITANDIAGGVSGTTWINENMDAVYAAIAAARGDEKAIRILADDIAGASIEGCERKVTLRQMVEARDRAALQAERAAVAARCPSLTDHVATMQPDQMQALCPAR